MGDFSITNPSTWSLGNLAETAAETLTGSEFLGDVVGAGVSFMTGDVFGGMDNVSDGLQNVGQFLSDPRVAQAASDAFGTGSTPKPEQCPVQQEGTAGGKEGVEGGGSLEDRIFALLMKLLEKKEGEVEGKLKDLEGAEGGDSEKTELQKLQKANGELSSLNSLITNITQSMNESKMAVIRNIR